MNKVRKIIKATFLLDQKKVTYHLLSIFLKCTNSWPLTRNFKNSCTWHEKFTRSSTYLNECSASWAFFSLLSSVCSVDRSPTPESTKVAKTKVFCWFGWIICSMSLHPVASSSVLTVLICRANVFSTGFLFSRKNIFPFNLYSLCCLVSKNISICKGS